VTLKEALSCARVVLTASTIEDVPLECELLVRHALGINRVQLYTDLSYELSFKQEEIFWQIAKRRVNHEPTAYITGHSEFYGLDFHIDPRVLIPRSESELLVDQALEFAGKHSIKKQHPYLIAEVGTGSGAIAISIALHLPQAKIYASDISAPALEVAAINCQRHTVTSQIELLLGDMLEPFPEPVDLIVANLPYIKDSEIKKLSPEIQMFEPMLALTGGKDGLNKVRQLLDQAIGKLKSGGSMLLELGEEQAPEAMSSVKHYLPGASVELVPDLLGIDRVLKISSISLGSASA